MSSALLVTTACLALSSMTPSGTSYTYKYTEQSITTTPETKQLPTRTISLTDMINILLEFELEELDEQNDHDDDIIIEVITEEESNGEGESTEIIEVISGEMSGESNQVTGETSGETVNATGESFPGESALGEDFAVLK